jgi:hypothetical protein
MSGAGMTFCPFQISGDYITKTARDWFYAEHRPYKKVLELLLNCMNGTGHSKAELIGFAHDVLLGKRKFAGYSKDDTLCLTDDDVDIFTVYPDARINPPPGKYPEVLKPPAPPETYGWLHPNGSYYPVAWGNHEGWAGRYIERNYPRKAWFSQPVGSTAGDFLVARGWVLLHNPLGGDAVLTHRKAFTKDQKEFLSDYYIARDQPHLAKTIWDDRKAASGDEV